MKKLMIAAAAAAMICGVEAVPLAYNFSATLKTTTGKAGGKDSTSYTVNLGVNDAGDFWYEDAGVGPIYQIKKVPNSNPVAYYKEDQFGINIGTIDISDLKTTKGWFADFAGYEAIISFTLKNNKGIGKLSANFNALENDDKWNVADAFSAGWNFVAAGETLYNNKSAGKWCQTFKFKSNIAACYRNAGSKKIKGLYVADECCDLAFIAEDDDALELGDLNFLFINRFGGVTPAKATKVEAFASLGDDIADGVSANQFSLAGQGTWKDKLIKIDDDYVAGVSAINGSIVGELDAPTCEYCCQAPDDAIAFECDGTFDPTLSLLTAAYGTWNLKFNSKVTKELNP